jgi:hypothetical protein
MTTATCSGPASMAGRRWCSRGTRGPGGGLSATSTMMGFRLRIVAACSRSGTRWQRASRLGMRQRHAPGPGSRMIGSSGTDDRLWWHNGVLGDRSVRAHDGFEKLLSVARESVGPKILGHRT